MLPRLNVSATSATFFSAKHLRVAVQAQLEVGFRLLS